MKKQSYRNHIRFYTPHHFIFYPVLMILLAISIYKICTAEDPLVWVFISIIFLFFTFLGLMLRQHYALTLQNRIVKLELRYRYFSISGKKLEDFENQLSDEQIFALRFTPDEELIDLVKKTLTEKLTEKAIKKSIVNWKSDHERV